MERRGRSGGGEESSYRSPPSSGRSICGGRIEGRKESRGLDRYKTHLRTEVTKKESLEEVLASGNRDIRWEKGPIIEPRDRVKGDENKHLQSVSRRNKRKQQGAGRLLKNGGLLEVKKQKTGRRVVSKETPRKHGKKKLS